MWGPRCLAGLGLAPVRTGMSSKWRRFAEQLVGAVKPGGVERSTLGTSINVSSNGTSTIPARDLERIVFKRFEDMRFRERRIAKESAPSASETE
jgi:hypothetical protein